MKILGKVESIAENRGNISMGDTTAVISGSGIWIPPNSISNRELVESYNAFADVYNTRNEAAINAGSIAPKPQSSVDFIEKASGIKNRYVYVKEGILDINRMRPLMPPRSDEEISQQAEMAMQAGRAALEAASLEPSDIDVVIVACSYTQRSYPSIAIEVQHALGINGFAFDMLVACSSATFGIQRAREMILSRTANRVLILNPELISPQIDFTDRDSHFIFGDVATATVVENADQCRSSRAFEIISSRAATVYSNNIRSNFGHLSRVMDVEPFASENLFHQSGRKVFKEVCPMVVEHLKEHLQEQQMDTTEVSRWWLHQANINMNQLISRKLLGDAASADKAPIVLDRFANTASAGSLIAFNLHQQDLESGDKGVICSFGAGYSIGSLILSKC